MNIYIEKALEELGLHINEVKGDLVNVVFAKAVVIRLLEEK